MTASELTELTELAARVEAGSGDQELREAIERALLPIDGNNRTKQARAVLAVVKVAYTDRLELLEDALFSAYNYIGAMQFQQDAGSPPIIKDGIVDRILAQCRRALAAQQQDRPKEIE